MRKLYNIAKWPHIRLARMCGHTFVIKHIGHLKKTGHSINSALKRGSEFSDDISAYDLILKNKERLLSFDEPTRFIFSHSALREGWDNPNVFQICTLKHSDSSTQKRQEVGRGLRLCVNQAGNRMDAEVLGDRIHDINKLTVIASESYHPKRWKDCKVNGNYVLRGHNRELALKNGLPVSYDRLALLAVSIYHLAHWRHDVTVANYLLAI